MAPRRRLGNQPEQPNQGFFDAMFTAFQGMATRARNERPAGDRKQEYFREFRRAPIPSFNSEGGPQEAEFWIDSIVKHLSTMGVPNEY